MHNEFGSTLLCLRESRHLSQLDVASALGIKRETYASYEYNRSRFPIEYLIPLSKLLNYSVEYILTYTAMTEKEYTDKFEVLNGFVRWGMRNKHQVNKVVYMSNNFNGDFDGCVDLTYMISKMDDCHRLRIGHNILDIFKSEYNEGNIDMDEDEYNDLCQEFDDILHRLLTKVIRELNNG